MLTEAVRRRPYSVVLLDEVEKAHPDVHEIFFQVFDKGMMEDGEGRRIDFKNTLILLTSNVGTELIMSMCKDPELHAASPRASPRRCASRCSRSSRRRCSAALVAIPYYPLSDEMLGRSRELQLEQDRRRSRAGHEADSVSATT